MQKQAEFAHGYNGGLIVFAENEKTKKISEIRRTI
tara:strand:- start:215 stop:319 length:105 start_codon:yes stop_codon:yes gene_type:complete